MIKKFSKSYGNMWTFKESLTTENETFVKKNKKFYELYNQQPERKFCKICRGSSWRWQFHSHGVLYRCCDQCGHINGSHEDTPEYCQKLYESAGGIFEDYYADIDKEKYISRMKAIYLPKAEFLKEALNTGGGAENPLRLEYLDLGAGSGHFVLAMRNLGFRASGVEVDRHQVQYANKILEDEALVHVPSEDMEDYISNALANVITCIYAFEHIVNVIEIFDAIQRNDNIRYIYFSVPMFSYSAMIDSINPEVYARLLEPAHTHIYTNESIEWLCKKYGWTTLGEWRFGADIADMLRVLMVKLNMQGDVTFSKICQKRFGMIIDDLQHVLDKNEFCSDIHILVKKS